MTALKITRLNKKGNGMALVDERSVEVPFVLPGEEVEVSSTRRGKGTLESILVASSERVTPRCVHFGTCGGCRLQHASYPFQLRFKEELVASCFKEVGTPSPIIPSLSPWHYRNKMEYSFSSDKKGERYLGLMMSQGRGKVVQLSECHLPEKWYVEAIFTAKKWWEESGLTSFNMRNGSGALRTLTLRDSQQTGDRMVILTVSGNADYALTRPQINSFVSEMKSHISPTTPDSRLSLFLSIHMAKKGEPTQFFEMHLSGPDHIREVLTVAGRTLTFHVSPQAFFQPNPKQAERLYEKAFSLANVPQGGVVYDLYCGTGTLGIFAAAVGAKQVFGIEISPEAVLDAKANGKLNGFENVNFYCGDVPKVLQKESLPRPDLVMVNPPRVGLDKDAITFLTDLAPPKILYISCNPVTQAENVIEFVQSGYSVSAIQPVDQFPHTVHIENIVVLEKR